MIRSLPLIILLTTYVLLAACTSKKQSRVKEREVPIAIVIKSNDPDLTAVNFDLFMFKCLDELERFQRVDFTSVSPDENPEITLELNIENFTIWPKDQNVARRIFTRAVVIGTDAKGNPVYGTVRASADIIQEQWRANARFSTNLKIVRSPGKTFSRIFTPNYRRRFIYVENIQGDIRAIDPSISSAIRPPFDPQPDELLLELSKEEMLGRISDEIRSYYNKK